MNELQPYPAMKDSGVEWLGEVPEHWNLERGKSLFAKVDRPVRETDEVVTCFRDGTVTLRKNRRTRGFTESLKEIGYQGIRTGDLVIHAMDAFAGAVGVADSDGKGTPVYAVCEPKPNADARYHAFVIREMARNQWILALATGIRERSTDFRFGTYASQRVPLPPLPEQAAIVRYLDYVDRRVRRLVRAKRKLIALLTEQKQALIHRAVTRGLDPDAPLKDSGVEWLGEVPEHWEVRRLKTLCGMKSGEGITAMSMESSGEYPVYGGNGVRGYTAKFTHDGDFVLIGRQGALCGNVHIARGKFWASEHAVVATLRREHSLEWAAFTLEVMNLNQYSIAAAQPGLALDRVLSLPMPVPSKVEQGTITESISESITEIDTANARASREIDLLNEYRTRLIADVVTGKRDVRSAAARLPEVDPLDTEDNQLEDTFDTVAEEEAGNPGEAVER